jgi:hypothetical protein
LSRGRAPVQFYDDIFDALYLDRTDGNPRLVPLHQK